jgi:hypothetical protein
MVKIYFNKRVYFAMFSKGEEQFNVQTLRNSMDSTSFLANASLTVGFFIFSLAISIQKTDSILFTQYIILGILFFFSFFNFHISVKNFFNLSFLMNIRDTTQDKILYKIQIGKIHESDPRFITQKTEVDLFEDSERKKNLNSVIKLLKLATVHFSIGMKSLFFTIPVSLWVFTLNDWAFLGGTIFIIIVMYFYDHSV